tara:strand:- start:223 stop:453 length:231 start_codon:yes stop_codon:yes gene_type:complete
MKDHRQALVDTYREIHQTALAKAKAENNDPEALKKVTRDSADRALLKVLNSNFSIASCYTDKTEAVKASKLLGGSA